MLSIAHQHAALECVLCWNFVHAKHLLAPVLLTKQDHTVAQQGSLPTSPPLLLLPTCSLASKYGLTPPFHRHHVGFLETVQSPPESG